MDYTLKREVTLLRIFFIHYFNVHTAFITWQLGGRGANVLEINMFRHPIIFNTFPKARGEQWLPMSITTHLLEYLMFYRTHHFFFYIPSLNNFLCDNNWLQNVSFTFEMAQTGSWQWEMVKQAGAELCKAQRSFS